MLVITLLASCALEPDAPTFLGAAEAKRTIGEICDGEDNDGDGAVDEDCGQCDSIVTRGRGWWRTAACVIEGDATPFALLPLTVSTTTYSTFPQVMTALRANPTTTTGRLSQNLLIARLNEAAFLLTDLPYDDWDGDGANETVGELLATANGLVSAGTPGQKVAMNPLLNTLNNDGAAFATWFDSTCSGDWEICDGLDNDADGVTDEDCSCYDPYTYGLAADIQPIFDGACIGCHSDYPEYGYYAPWGLDLNAGLSWGNLYGVAAGGLPSMNRVEPGNSGSSYVIHKLEGTQLTVGGQGDQMPLYGPYLDAATIDMVRTWIDEGAPNN